MIAALRGRSSFSRLFLDRLAKDIAQDADMDPIFIVSGMALRIVIALVMSLACFTHMMGLHAASRNKSACRNITNAKRMAAQFVLLLVGNGLAVYGRSLVEIMQSGQHIHEKLWLVAATPWNVNPENMFGVIFSVFASHWCWISWKDLKEAMRMETAWMEEKTIQCDDIFQNPRVPFARCVVVFAFIALLVGLYLNDLWEPVYMTPKAHTFWAFAMVLQMFIATKHTLRHCRRDCWHDGLYRWFFQADFCYRPDLWPVLFSRTHRPATPMASRPSDDSDPFKSLTFFEACVRFIMSYVVNGLIPVIVLYTLPVFLARKDNAMDFVVDAFAITYLSDLDDNDEELEIR